MSFSANFEAGEQATEALQDFFDALSDRQAVLLAFVISSSVHWCFGAAQERKHHAVLRSRLESVEVYWRC
jgi:hypothetical protein